MSAASVFRENLDWGSSARKVVRIPPGMGVDHERNQTTPRESDNLPPGDNGDRCAECGRELEVPWQTYRRGVRRFCSPRCRYRHRDRERWANPDYREKKLAAMRAARDQRRKQRTCRDCDQPASSQRHHLCDECRAEANARRAARRRSSPKKTAGE